MLLGWIVQFIDTRKVQVKGEENVSVKVKRQRELLCAVMGKVAVALVFNGLCYATRKTTIPNVQVIVEQSIPKKGWFWHYGQKNTDGWSIIEHAALYTVKSDIGKVKWWERAALTSWACSLECFGRLQGCPPSARSFPGSSSLYFFFFLINWPA